MAKIPLREYNREIDELIDQGQMEQAIAHCRHILQFYPKHIDTYRSLGKAYLEAQRYSDASDVLQRVLSSVPDDFVSHIGMSLIREDEGNLEEAIWHMERAFENQPSNSAIQSELKRLYGRREGMEPPKVRLTRGALARMYLKGELYPQAIAELRSALSREQARPDLEVLLAQAYYQAQKPVQAAETCSTLLKRLPFALVGNQIMANILANSKRAHEARIYLQRVQAMDPYSAHLSPKTTSPEEVPDVAITLERLDWRPGDTSGAPSQPDWATSVGVDLKDLDEGEEELPEWLGSTSEELPDRQEMEFESAPPFEFGDDLGEELSDHDREPEVEEFSQVPPEPLTGMDSEDQDIELSSEGEEDIIPDWMKEAGWEQATGDLEESPSYLDEAALDQEETDEFDNEAAMADIPDWLQSMAPEDNDEAMDSGEEDPDWLEGLELDSADAEFELQDEGLRDPDERVEELEIESELDWQAEEDVTMGEVPDWMQEFEEAGESSARESEEIESIEKDSLTGTEEETPDRMEEKEQDKVPSFEPQDSQEGEQMPERFDEESHFDFENETDQPGEAPEESEWFSEESIETEDELGTKRTGVTDWLKSRREEEEETEPESIENSLSTKDFEEDAFPKDEESKAELSEDEREQLPEWLKDLSETEEPVTIESSDDELPEWLQAVDEETESEIDFDEEEALIIPELTEEESFESQSEAEEPPDWMADMTDEQDTTAQEIEAGLPTWAAEEEGETYEEESDLFEEPLITEEDTQPTRVTPVDQVPIPPAELDEGESLQAEPAEMEPEGEIADEILPPEGVTPPEGKLEEAETPEWLQDWREETETWEEIESGLVSEGGEPEETISPEPEAAESPELDELETEMAIGQDSEEYLPDSETPPEWVPDAMSGGAGEETDRIDPELETTAKEPEAAEGEELIEAEGASLEAEEEQPEEIEELEEETGPQAEESPQKIPSEFEREEQKKAEEPSTLDDEDAFAWLESLAAKQGAEEALLLDPSERREEPPEWIKKAIEEETEPEIEKEDIDEPLSKEDQISTQALEAAAEASGQAEEAQPGEPESATEPISPIQAETPIDEQPPELPEWLEGIEEETEEGEPAWTPPQEEEPSVVGSEAPVVTEDLVDTTEDHPEAVEAETPGEEEEETEGLIVEKDEPAPRVEKVEKAEPEEIEISIPERVDINTAGLSDLERIPGIGFTRAQAIVAHRETYGQFTRIQDLEDIFGIGPSLLNEIKDWITVKISPEIVVEDLPEGEGDVFIMEARSLLVEGNLDEALTKYNALITNNQRLSEVIQDLKEALYHHPVDVDLWQALGDAQMRSGQFQEALDSYSKAEELLR